MYTRNHCLPYKCENLPMPYIKRDLTHKISSLSMTESAEYTEYLASTNPEIVEFLHLSQDANATKASLEESDMEFVRVAEDLINTLISQKVILFTDLPEATQEKLLGREKLRQQLQGERNDSFMDDTEESFF